MESPDELQNLCINYIAKNVSTVFEEVKNEWGDVLKYAFKSPNIYLPVFVSEQLLSALDANGLTDLHLTIFDPACTRLQRICIQDCDNLTTRHLGILKLHKVSDLTVVGLNTIQVDDLIDCLGEWTIENLRSLNVSCSTSVCTERIKIPIALSMLKNLRCLDVSHSEFNSKGLEIIAEDLPMLESLNIARTLVTDITALRKCKDRLKCLNMHNLNPKLCEIRNVKCLRILWELNNLQHLDISDDEEQALEVDSVVNEVFTQFLKDSKCLPQLMSLDVSGRNVDIDSIKIFLENHPQMKFLGLLGTEACESSMFYKPTNHSLCPKLVIAGHATEEQTLESMRRYKNRLPFIRKCLCSLYDFIQNLVEERLDIIKLVLQCMYYTYNLGIQMAATACLYNLTKGGLSFRIHTFWLKQIVDLTLIAMENFPKQRQLQRNSLLTLCTDRMLQDVSFNRYHCAKLVIRSLMTFDDPAMNRMSVAICSILAARISTAETSSLGTRGDFMERLLTIVKTKCLHGEIDIMMKFTLSALWNLTDESPCTCSVFLNCGGMDVYLNVLNKFPRDSSVETKVLGLLNNIAEVPSLREHLKRAEFITVLQTLLHSDYIDVSYFAAGIVAHIASDGEELWTCTTCTWDDIVSELGSAVCSWEGPEMEMVAYRSFKPFYQLFSCYKAYQVQLWAAWAIYHVCSKNPKRYCFMLIEEGGKHVLQAAVINPDAHPSVSNICLDILSLITEHPKSLCSHTKYSNLNINQNDCKL